MELDEKIRIATEKMIQLEKARGRDAFDVFSKGNCGNFFRLLKHALETEPNVKVVPVYVKSHVYAKVSQGSEYYLCDVHEVISGKFVMNFTYDDHIKLGREMLRDMYDVKFAARNGIKEGFYDVFSMMYYRYGESVFDMAANDVSATALENNYSARFLKREPALIGSIAEDILAHAVLSAQQQLLREAMGMLPPKEYEKKLHSENLAALDVWLKTKPFGGGKKERGV